MSFQPLIFNGIIVGQTGGGGGSGTVTSVGLSLPGILTVSGSPVTTSGTLTGSLVSQSANTFFAGPNGSSGTPTFRLIVPADIPTLNQNTTGTAANITATSNSTLTTLSSLSLPYSQVTGAPTSANTTLSNLTSPTSVNQSLIPSSSNSLSLGVNTNVVFASNIFTSGFGQEAINSSQNTTRILGQGFTAQSTGPVSSISVALNYVTSPLSGLGTIQLQSDNGSGHPSGTILASATFDTGLLPLYNGSTIGTLTTVNISASLVSGTKYHIVVDTTALTYPSGSELVWLETDPSPGGVGTIGNEFSNNNGSTWGYFDFPTENFYFVIQDFNVSSWANGYFGTLVQTPALQLEGATSGSVTLKSNATTTSYSLFFPNAQGGSNQTISNDGSGNLSWVAISSGSVTSVALADSTNTFNISGSPVTSTGTLTLSSFKSQTGNTFLAAPNGSAGVPTFRAIVSADVPTLNQNTTGTAANITATSNSTLTTLSSLSLSATQLTGTLQAAQFPALTGDVTTTAGALATTLATVNSNVGSFTNANITVNAKGLITAASNGSAGFTNPMTTLGDIIYENAVPAAARLAGNITTTKNFLVQTGTGSVSAAPSWGTIATTDVPTLNQNTTGTAANITATSNSTLTTLSSLSLPASQLTGTTLPSSIVSSSLTSLGAQSQALNMNSNLINNVSPGVSGTDAINLNQLNNAVAGINPAVAVQAATTSASNTSGYTYNNGVSGVGATLTANSNNTPLTVDGFTFSAIGQRLLVKNDTQSPSGAFNGIYYVTQLSTSLLPVILTRALDYDAPSDMNNTGAIPVINGTINGTTQWVLTSQVVTVGTTPLTFAQFSNNPANNLLAANNLSDVASKSTSFNNISPITTTGDLIYSSSGATNSRLPVGTAGQVLTVSGGVPSWQPAPGTVSAFFASSQVTTTSSAITSGTFTTFSNSPAFTFTPTITGTYKIYSSIPFYVDTLNCVGVGRVINTSGGATLLQESQTTTYGSTSAVVVSTTIESVYTLTSGTSYQFDIQGKVASGSPNLFLRGDLANFYMFAELEVAGTASQPTGSNVSAYFTNSSSWSTSSTSFTDATNSGGNTLTSRGTPTITLTAAASNVCGVTFTPPSATAVYLITAIVGVGNSVSPNAVITQLTDGTTVISNPAAYIGASSTESQGQSVLTGVYTPGTTSPVTVKVQLGTNSGGTASISGNQSTSNSVEWTIIRIA